MALDERTRIAHLLRRAGFGATSAELEEYRLLGFDRAVDRLVDYEAIATDLQTGLEEFDETVPTNGMVRNNNTQLFLTWWYGRMWNSPRPLQEKMVLFWNSHLTTSARSADESLWVLKQNQFHRDNAMARFGDILKGVSKQPAMMRYLDTYLNRRNAPNENYARELLELYGLGIGNYTETDVKEAARAFTGWNHDRQGKFVVQAAQHDNGAKTILGYTGNWDGDNVVDFIMMHPAMPEYLTGRLWSFFVWEHPSAADLAPAVDTFNRSRFSIRETMRTILKSPAFSSDRAYRARLKTPVEHVVGTYHLLGVKPANGLNQLMTRMGQNPIEPPNPKGWVDDSSGYLNATTWLERINWANTMSQRNAQSGNLTVEQFLPSGLQTSPERAVDHLAERFIDGRLGDESRSAMLQYAGMRMDDTKARGLLYLVLTSPEYQLA